MLDVGIKETTTTTGPGSVTLSAVAGFVRVSDAFGVGDVVSYCLVSGNGDKEWGVGSAGVGNTLSRDAVAATLVGATFTRGGSPIALTGTSELIVTEHSAAVANNNLRVRTPVASAYMSPILESGTAGSTIGLTANRLYAVPFYAPSHCDLTGVGLVVTTLAAGTAYVGVAESVRVGGAYKPGRLLGQGSLDAGSTGIKTDTASYVPKLHAGHLYWMLLTCTSAASIRALASANLVSSLGIGTDALTPYTWMFVAQAGPIPADLSGLTWSLPTPGLTCPHLFFTT